MAKLTGIKKRGKRTFEIRYYDADGVRHYETVTARTATEATGIRSARLADIAKGIPVSSRPNTVRFEELCADVVNHYIVNKLSSMPDIEARYRVHILPRLGRRKAATITTAQLNHYILSRQADNPPPSTGTVNRELEAIRRAFLLAFSGNKILTKGPHIPMLKENNVRTGFFTREEVERLCSHLKSPLDSFVKLAFLTGWRYEEIRTLKWANVDFVAGEIRLEPGTTKNDEGRVFPMNAELGALLESLTRTGSASAPKAIGSVKIARMATPAHFVFMLNSKPIGQFRKSWKTANHKAGLPCVVDINGKLIRAVRIFHDLRRSAARHMQLCGIHEGEIMRLMGHKTRSMFDRYRIVSDADLREAVRKMDANHSPSSDRKDGQK